MGDYFAVVYSFENLFPTAYSGKTKIIKIHYEVWQILADTTARTNENLSKFDCVACDVQCAQSALQQAIEWEN